MHQRPTPGGPGATPDFSPFAVVWPSQSSMELLIILIVVFVVLAGLLVVSRRQAAAQQGGGVPYERRHLFTKAERSFLAALDEATGDQVRVFAKVPLAGLLQVPSSVGGGERRGAAQRLAQQQVDFVLCDPGDLRVLSVVEFEDGSPSSRRPKERDVLVDEALASAGIPVIRFAAGSAPGVDEVRHKLAPVMPAVPPPAPSAKRAKPGKKRAGRPRDATGAPAAVVAVEPAPTPELISDVTTEERTAPPQDEGPQRAPVLDEVPSVTPAAATRSTAPAASPAAAPTTPSRSPSARSTPARVAQDADPERDRYARLGTCPTCGKPLVERVGKRGALKGKTYLVCSGDPPCEPLVTEA
jgi:hypothetical protein